MISGKIIKLVVFELLEFAAFSIPTLVIMEQFATAYHRARNLPERTHYWLIVSCSVAYVAVVTLLIWVPIKVLLYRKCHLYKKITGWRPVLMMCVILTTLPSFSFSIAVTEVQRNNNGSIDLLPDSLPDLPVSLVLLSLIVVDILEKLRMYPLRGREKKCVHSFEPWKQYPGHGSSQDRFRALGGGNEDGHIHVASLQQMKTVTEQVGQDGGSLALSQVAKAPGTSQPQLPSHVPVGPQEPSFDSGILRTMSRRDVRAEIFLWSFLRWADTIEMVRVAGHPAVYKSGWLYPVYIFSFLSVLRIVFTPENPLLSSLGVLLQDLPFVFVRFTLVIALGTITPILGLCKNVLVTLSYVYFNYLTRFRPFSSLETSLS